MPTLTTPLDQADNARGARVELAIEAAQRGNLALAAGILAGFSAEERDAFGPLIVASFPSKSSVSTRLRADPFGSDTMRRIDRDQADGLDVPQWVNGR